MAEVMVQNAVYRATVYRTGVKIKILHEVEPEFDEKKLILDPIIH